MSIQWNQELYHYGMPRRSGRYKWGSGEDPYHHGASAPSRRTKRLQKKTARMNLMAGANRQAANNANNPLRAMNRVNEKYYSKKAAAYKQKLVNSKALDEAKADYKAFKKAKPTHAELKADRLERKQERKNIKEEYDKALTRAGDKYANSPQKKGDTKTLIRDTKEWRRDREKARDAAYLATRDTKLNTKRANYKAEKNARKLEMKLLKAGADPEKAKAAGKARIDRIKTLKEYEYEALLGPNRKYTSTIAKLANGTKHSQKTQADARRALVRDNEARVAAERSSHKKSTRVAGAIDNINYKPTNYVQNKLADFNENRYNAATHKKRRRR